MEDQEKNNNEVIKDEKVDVEDATNVDNADPSREAYTNKPTNKVVEWFKKVGAWFKDTWEKLEKKLGIKNLVIIGYATLAVILVILIVSLSVVSVKYNKVSNGTLNGNTINGAGSNNSATVSQKEEQLFTTWKEGMNATAKYDGVYSITSKSKSTTTDNDVETHVVSEEENEILLNDGQFIYKVNHNEKRYDVDTKETTNSDNISYNVIIKDGDQYKEFSEGTGIFYLVDEYAYKNIKKESLEALQSAKCEGIWVASADSFKNATNKLNIFLTTGYLDDIATNSSVEISEIDGAVVLSLKYSCYESATTICTYEKKYSVKGEKVVKIEEKVTADGTDLDNSATTKIVSEEVTNIEYESNVATFAQLTEGVSIPTERVALNTSVDYYINDYYYSDFSAIGETISYLTNTSYIDWYIDKDLTTPYTNQIVRGDGLSLYGKIKTPGSSEIYLMLGYSYTYTYPDYYPEVLKSEPSTYMRNDLYAFDSVDACKSKVDLYNSEDVSKYNINGKDYTVEEFNNFQFELGKTYIVIYYRTTSGLYS